MQKIIVTLPEIKLIGISARTNNAQEISGNGVIMPTLGRYFGQQLFDAIPHRKKPGTTFCIYTNYESDFRADYTYFVGEEVSSFSDLPEELETLIIPPQRYVKFTNGPDAMPKVVQEPWFKIWQMSEHELGGPRRYVADFEIYDERAHNRERTILDIYIGIE